MISSAVGALGHIHPVPCPATERPTDSLRQKVTILPKVTILNGLINEYKPPLDADIRSSQAGTEFFIPTGSTRRIWRASTR